MKWFILLAFAYQLIVASAVLARHRRVTASSAIAVLGFLCAWNVITFI